MTGAPVEHPGVEGHLSGRLGAFDLDADFTIAPRGVTALIGPSGSGKTTLLRAIAGLARLSGDLTVDGHVWQDERTFLAPHLRSVGMVFQDASLLAHLSVDANLTFGMKRSRDPRAIHFADVIEMLGLEKLLGRSTANLSGGERQRVALGRALLSQPRLLLMDEPLSNLDLDSKTEIWPYLERLHQELDVPVLYVSHDLSEVRRLADHVLVMHKGRIVESRTNVRHDADTARLAAEQRLSAMPPGQINSLALAALLAGLDPARPY